MGGRAGSGGGDLQVRGAADVQAAVAEVAAGFAAHRLDRQRRVELDPADFALLADAGLRGSGLPVERGGLFADLRSSTRTLCELQRTLAHGDPAVALVTAMHPAVLALWLCTPSVPEPHTGAWSAQRDAVFATVEDGAWWGTITSEPGSGGDVGRTKAVAVPIADAEPGPPPLTRLGPPRWALSGAKHFGSGTGISASMVTTARVDGEERPDWFFVPTADNEFDGSEGITIAAPWDGAGMRATQSHALTFDACPVHRVAWPGHLDDLMVTTAPLVATLFTSVVLGVVETAIATAQEQLGPKAASLRPYEQVEWTQAVLEAWTLEQVYEGALRAIESGAPARVAATRAKVVGAQLAESCLTRTCKVLGGGTYSQRSPFSHWFEDVRALGFLRPPWGLAVDGLFASALPTPG
jgi:alkylation response protein AidB-like acyl-CoA dehydrogenase